MTFNFGSLVLNKKYKNTYFSDKDNKMYMLTKVHFINSHWNEYEGINQLPTPTILDEEENLVSTGDKLIYAPIGADEIIVLGSARNLNFTTNDSNIDYVPGEEEQVSIFSETRNNSNRYYLKKDDGKGDILIHLEGKNEGTGNLILKLKGTDNNGKFILDVNGKVVIAQRDAEGNKISEILLDNTKDNEKISIKDKFKNQIEINKKGTIINTATIRIGDDTITLKKIFDKLFDALKKMSHNTPTGPTQPTPINWSEFETIKSDINKFMDVQ